MQNMLFILVLLASTILSEERLVNAKEIVLDVTKYGAKGDGRTDDTAAFKEMWKYLCPTYSTGFSKSIKAIIPYSGEFVLRQIEFKGPCYDANMITFQVDGRILAQPNKLGSLTAEKQPWITFSGISNLTISGKGAFEGNADWGNNGLMDLNGEDGRTNTAFHDCHHVYISGISSTHSERNHISISDCTDVHISDIHLTSPGTSKNTDGIDISNSQWLEIKDSTIATGDDCIQIGYQTSNVNISNVHCGPGHGISIGSFQKGKANVENVYVQHCSFDGTMNGARIKNFQNGDEGGFVRSITFEDIVFKNVERPIVIDQYYDPNALQSGTVQISGIKFIGFEGTCSGEEAISIKCNNGTGCTDITLGNVHITGSRGQPVHSVCSNVHGSIYSTWPSVKCLIDHAYADDIEEDLVNVDEYVS